MKMKKIITTGALLLGITAVTEGKAQVQVNVNIGPPPVYVTPAHTVSYYYYPELQAYYYIPAKRYYYQSGGRWITASYIPGYPPGHSVYRTSHIAIHGSKPYLKHSYYFSKYNGKSKAGRHYKHRGKGKKHGHR